MGEVILLSKQKRTRSSLFQRLILEIIFGLLKTKTQRSCIVLIPQITMRFFNSQESSSLARVSENIRWSTGPVIQLKTWKTDTTGTYPSKVCHYSKHTVRIAGPTTSNNLRLCIQSPKMQRFISRSYHFIFKIFLLYFPGNFMVRMIFLTISIDIPNAVK